MTILWAILAAIVGALALILWRIRRRIEPTRGPRIPDYAEPQKALLLIDMQEDYIGVDATPPFPYAGVDQLLDAANRALDAASARSMLVVYVRHQFQGWEGRLFSRIFSHGASLPGSPGASLDPRIKRVSEHMFIKSMSDAFTCAELGEFLKARQVNELYLMGLDAAYCVHATAMGGVRRGYTVHVLSDAVVTKAEKRWAALQKGYASKTVDLMTSEEFAGPSR